MFTTLFEEYRARENREIKNRIKSCITCSLDLSSVCIGNKLATEISSFLSLIPPVVVSLNLSHNRLNVELGNKLAMLFDGMPPQITLLDLSYNCLSSISKLASFFSNIPINVTSLNLVGNNFGNITSTELEKIFLAIPKNVREITLSYSDISSYSQDELIILSQALPNVMKINFYDDALNMVTESNPRVMLFKGNIGIAIVEKYLILSIFLPLEGDNGCLRLVNEYEGGTPIDEVVEFCQKNPFYQKKVISRHPLLESKGAAEDEGDAINNLNSKKS